MGKEGRNDLELPGYIAFVYAKIITINIEMLFSPFLWLD